MNDSDAAQGVVGSQQPQAGGLANQPARVSSFFPLIIFSLLYLKTSVFPFILWLFLITNFWDIFKFNGFCF